MSGKSFVSSIVTTCLFGVFTILVTTSNAAMPNRQVALLLIAALMAYAGGLFVAWDAVNPAQRQGRSAGTVITAVMCAGILAALIDLRYAQPEYACVLGTVLGAFALPATTGLVIQRLMAHGAAE